MTPCCFNCLHEKGKHLNLPALNPVLVFPTTFRGFVAIILSRETKEKRAFTDRHENTRACIDYMRPRCAQLSRVLKKTGSFYYYHCDWHASSEALQEIESFFKRSHKVIVALTVQKILEEQIAKKLA